MLLLIGSPWLLDFLRWRLAQGRADEAWSIIGRLNYTLAGDGTLLKKGSNRQKQLEAYKLVKKGKREIFTTSPNRRRSIIGFGLIFGNYFTVNNYPALLSKHGN